MTKSLYKKRIEDLPKDIYSLLEGGLDISDEEVDKLAAAIAETVRTKFRKRTRPHNPRLYCSNFGKPDRQLWYDMRSTEPKVYEPRMLLNFFFGDMYEEVLLFLAEQAGHTVEDTQKRFTIEGINGYMDARIDGVVTDVKTALGYNYQKFSRGTLFEPNNDPYGYQAQISAYVQADEDVPYSELETDGAFLATDKAGNLCVMKVDALQQIDVVARIKDIRATIAEDTPPAELCYPEVLHANGNVEVHKQCSFCQHKKDCFPTMRVFKYSNGWKFFSHVEKEPRVEEIIIV